MDVLPAEVDVESPLNATIDRYKKHQDHRVSTETVMPARTQRTVTNGGLSRGTVARRGDKGAALGMHELLYASFVLVCFCVLLLHGLKLSNEYASMAPGLRKGWISGRPVDLSDIQWRDFRGSIPAMGFVFSIFALVSRVCSNINGKARMVWIVAFGAVFLVYLHGRCAVYVWGLVSLNYCLAQFLKRSTLARGIPSLWKTMVVWVVNIGALIVVKGTDGFQFLDGLWEDRAVQSVSAFATKGVFRWQVCFNMTMLRMISQSLDIVWEEREKGVSRDIEEDELSASYWSALAHALYPRCIWPVRSLRTRISHLNFNHILQDQMDGIRKGRRRPC
jgi:hypothetical protein